MFPPRALAEPPTTQCTAPGRTDDMPIVRIDVTGPKTVEWKRAVLDGVRAGVTEGLAVPDSRVTLRLVETADDCVDIPDCRTARYTLIDVLAYEGHPPEAKAALVAAVRRRLAADPGIEPSEVAISIRDASKTDLDVMPGEASGLA
jgi:phenylpyruvate tautomerase PptA (4-oxalocrotonate tautomerase family)